MKKRIFLIMTLLLLFLFPRNEIEAKESYVIPLDQGKTYKIDLDGDGKKEKVCYKIYGIKECQSCFIGIRECGIYINDVVKKKINVGCGCDGKEKNIYKFGVSDFNTKDRYKELIISFDYGEYGQDYKCDLIAYRYNEKKLKKYFHNTFEKWRGYCARQPGDGKVVVCGFGDIVSVYKVFKIKNKKLVEIKNKSGIYSINSEYEKVVVEKEVKVQKTISNAKSEFFLEVGDLITAKKVKMIENYCEYVYIETGTGKTGWIKSEDWQELKELYEE